MPTKTPEKCRRWVTNVLADETNVSATARVCRAILGNREPFDVDELAEKLGSTVSSVYLVMGDLRRAGYPVEKVRPRVFQLTGEQGSEPVPLENTGRGASKGGAVVHVPPRNGRKVAGLPASFLRPPAEGLPVLGEVLRVSMLAESDHGEALVLQGADGRRYMVRVDSP